MAKIIITANQKGGVGKTTTALAMAGILAKKGKRVLLVDLDPQGNATLGCGAGNDDFATITDVLSNEVDIKEAIVKMAEFDVIQGCQSLANFEQELMSKLGREYRLKEVLDKVTDCYEYIIIDTPPQLSILTVNALTACDEVIIPALADIFSLQGIGQLIETIAEIKKYSNEKIVVSGILLTKFSEKATLSKDVKELIEKYAIDNGTKLFNTKIRETVAVKESQIEQRVLTEYKRATALSDYEEFIKEILR